MSLRSSLVDVANRGARSVWGEAVTYAPAVGDEEEIRGVFDMPYELVSAGGEVGVSSRVPMLYVRLADMTATPAQLDTLTVGGVTYQVVDVQRDGNGGADLQLMEVIE